MVLTMYIVQTNTHTHPCGSCGSQIFYIVFCLNLCCTGQHTSAVSWKEWCDLVCLGTIRISRCFHSSGLNDALRCQLDANRNEVKLLKQFKNHPVANEADNTYCQPLNNPEPAGRPREGNQIPPVAVGNQMIQSSVKYIFKAIIKKTIQM